MEISAHVKISAIILLIRAIAIGYAVSFSFPVLVLSPRSFVHSPFFCLLRTRVTGDAPVDQRRRRLWRPPCWPQWPLSAMAASVAAAGYGGLCHVAPGYDAATAVLTISVGRGPF